MPGRFHHEEIYRGPESVAKLSRVPVTICGAGALGSLLADNLARQGFTNLRAIDHDRIEEHNLGTQLYGLGDVGAFKVESLRNMLFRSTGVELDAVRKELTPKNAATLLKGTALVIDCFDNTAARRAVQDAVRAAGVACLHVGLFADYAEVVWDERYRVPADTAGDVCDYPLARNLVLVAVAVASETVVRFALTGECTDWTATLADFTIRPLEPPA